MDHVEIITKRVIRLIPGALSPHEGVEFNIKCFAVDFATLCKNIKETSFGEHDRHQRCQKLSQESGIDVSHIKKLTE